MEQADEQVSCIPMTDSITGNDRMKKWKGRDIRVEKEREKSAVQPGFRTWIPAGASHVKYVMHPKYFHYFHYTHCIKAATTHQ